MISFAWCLSAGDGGSTAASACCARTSAWAGRCRSAYETIAGLAHLRGCIHAQGETLEVGSLRIRVAVAEPRAIREVEIGLPAPGDSG